MKKDQQGNDLTFEKVLDLSDYGGNLGVWKVDIERCREQDKNARVMDKAVFDQLKENMISSNGLESLPYGYIRDSAGGLEFVIISGHHRVRAARSAQITIIYVIATTDQLTHDEIVSKQLSHNALSGQDDEQVLKELFDSIADINDKTRSGIRTSDFDKMKFRPVPADEVGLEYASKSIRFMFLDSQVEDFEKTCEEIYAHETVYVASKLGEYDAIVETLRKVSKNENIRNVASIIGKMCEIVQEHYKGMVQDEDGANIVNTLSGVLEIFESVTGIKVEEIENSLVFKPYVGKSIEFIRSHIGDEEGPAMNRPRKSKKK